MKLICINRFKNAVKPALDKNIQFKTDQYFCSNIKAPNLAL